MLKPIGSLHNIPAPSAAVLGESVKLLSTFGDKKSISPFLEKMHEVQVHNDQVFRDAQAAISEIAKMRQELDDNRNSFVRKMVVEDLASRHRADELSQAEARFSGKAAKFAEEREAILSTLNYKQLEMDKSERLVIARETKCDERERDLDSRLAITNGKEAAIRNMQQQLQATEKRLRAALDGG